MEELKYIEFENYLKNELSETDKIAFEKRLHSDEDFKKEFEIYKALESSLSSKFENEEAETALRNTLTNLGSKYIKENLSQTETKTKTETGTKTLTETKTKTETKVIPLFNYKKLLVAASIALLIGFFIFKNGNPVYSDFSNHNNLELIVRGDNNEAINKAQNAFNTKNYSEALKQLTILSNEFPNDIEIKLYKGISLLELNNFNEADAIFETISAGNSAFSTKATWYKALSLLKQNKLDECKKVLKTIPESADEYALAKKLLKKL